MLATDTGRLLADFGSNLTLSRVSATVYAPSTGLMTAGTTTNFTIRAVFINYEDKNVDGTVVRAGDRRLLVSAVGSQTPPQIGDVVGGLKLIDVRTIAPRGVPIAWACQARK